MRINVLSDFQLNTFVRVDYQRAFRHPLNWVGETDHFQTFVLLISEKSEFFVTETDRMIYTHRYADTVFDEKRD